MKNLLIHLKKLDWILIVSTFLLISIGLLSIYSSSLGRDDFLNFKKQIIFIIVGLLLIFIFSFFDWRIFRDDSYLILILYFICFFLLLGLFFFAPEIRGVKSWYRLGPFTFDPIVLTKLILVILLAKYFSTRHVEMYHIRHILLSGVYVALPAILIFLQPNFGAVLIIFALWIGILIISGIKLKHFFILVLIGILFFAFSWSTLLKDYQRERILSFFYPVDPLGAGWSQNQARIAIGAGGFFGQGFTKGSQTQHGFLPEPQTDFIFASIAEEFGLIGIGVLFFLFSLFFWRIIKIATLTTSNFSRLFAIGFASVIFAQIFIHIGMNLGLLPIIGIPLPLVSYGGSSFMAICIGLGILQNMKINR